jgi:hypothetical protein
MDANPQFPSESCFDQNGFDQNGFDQNGSGTLDEFAADFPVNDITPAPEDWAQNGPAQAALLVSDGLAASPSAGINLSVVEEIWGDAALAYAGSVSGEEPPSVPIGSLIADAESMGNDAQMDEATQEPGLDKEIYLKEFVDSLLSLSKHDTESFEQVLFLLERAWAAQKRLWDMREGEPIVDPEEALLPAKEGLSSKFLWWRRNPSGPQDEPVLL